jgi:diguanylate cyclase (GGDEF)-like protein
MISSKIAVSISILVIIAGTGALAVALDAQARQRKHEFVQSSVESLQFLSLAVAPSVAIGMHHRVQTVLDTIAAYPEKFPDIRALEVIGRDGRVIADLDPRRFNLKRALPGLEEKMRLGQPLSQEVEPQLIEIYVPVRITYPLGVMRATISESRLYLPLQQQQRQAVLVVLVTAAALAVALHLVLRRVISQRIVKLAHVAMSLKEGHLNARAHVAGQDEISELADSFNRMAESMLEYTTNLEQLVAERTTALKQANARLEQLAITDPLTQLFNRRHFEERVARDLEVARRSKRPFTIVILDVDQFKQVNDRFGHLVGDEVLQRVATVLLTNARAMDLAARIGGEEFALAMPDTDTEEAVQAVERIRKQIALPRHFQAAKESQAHVVTASLGVASYPEHGETLKELMSAADTALYRAKQSGRNRVERA